MDKKKFTIITYGCQMNEHDSEKMAGILNDMGYEWTDNKEEADLILFNTCCVREHAEQRVYGNIGMLKPLKQKNPELLIGVGGCMMQQEGMAQELADKFPFVDIIFGTHNLDELPKLIDEARASRFTVIDIHQEDHEFDEAMPIRRTSRVSAWVTVMYGCNNFCTYCIVPYVRGREHSRRPKDIIREVETLAAEGYKEITLLGQNVNSYGKDLDEKVEFADLLRSLNEVDGIERIRFTTSHPKDLSDNLIYAMRDCEKVCDQLHLPVQSGSTAILKRMNRHYTKEDYLALVDKIKTHIPDIALSTDIIVGFPGETDEDFEDTMDVVRQVRYDLAYTFIYSKRSGTPAASMEDPIPREVKQQRLQRLIDLQTSITREKNQQLNGRVVEVLVEGPSRNGEGQMMGRTESNKVVNFDGDISLVGKLVDVRITEPSTWFLNGQLIDVKRG